MALICDTGGVYALYDADDVHHASTVRYIEREPGPLYLPVVLLSEIDYLLHSRLGVAAELDFLSALEREAFVLVHSTPGDITRCAELVRQYADLSLGLADAMVVAIGERLGIRRLLSVDERHFRTVVPRDLGHFELLPADGD